MIIWPIENGPSEFEIRAQWHSVAGLSIINLPVTTAAVMLVYVYPGKARGGEIR